jgi:Double zinc ribbon
MPRGLDAGHDGPSHQGRFEPQWGCQRPPNSGERRDMKCLKCQTENLVDSLFCEECGAALETACPACGIGNRPAAKFCRKCRASLVDSQPSRAESPNPASYTPKHLADKILQSKSALEGERKQVTVRRRRQGLDGAGGADGPGRVVADHEPLLRDPLGRSRALRGLRRQVHRRRHHGAVRRADLA